MNAFNRLIMLIISVLLIAVPVFLLLVAFGVISSSTVSQYVNYDAAVQSLNNVSTSSVAQGARVIIAVVGVILVLVALLLLLRELTFGRSVARGTVVDDTPGHETSLTAKAVKTLSEGAAREVGAVSPSVSLASSGNQYSVLCSVQAAAQSNYSQLATQVRENIQEALGKQKVPYKDVEVTVSGSAT